MRIEDLDPPRVIPGAADQQLRCLEQLGFAWDGVIVYQSSRLARYRQVLEQLSANGLVFPCSCSRREIIASAPHAGDEGPVYPGTCRQGSVGGRAERAMRLRVNDRPISFQDGVFGAQSQDLQQTVGDFVLYRADGVYAYQLAVVVDDIDAGVTQVVRGADLLTSTPRQIFLYRCLKQQFPDYFHLPLALGGDAEKLSKRHGSSAIVTKENGSLALWHALEFLGQQPPLELRRAAPGELLNWGCQFFRPERIPMQARPAPKL